MLADFALLAQTRAGRGGGGGGTSLKLENFIVRDLWEHKDLTLKETSVYIDILPHSVKVFRFIRK